MKSQIPLLWRGGENSKGIFDGVVEIYSNQLYIKIINRSGLKSAFLVYNQSALAKIYNCPISNSIFPLV
jgi:hypothetical protein